MITRSGFFKTIDLITSLNHVKPVRKQLIMTRVFSENVSSQRTLPQNLYIRTSVLRMHSLSQHHYQSRQFEALLIGDKAIGDRVSPLSRHTYVVPVES